MESVESDKAVTVTVTVFGKNAKSEFEHSKMLSIAHDMPYHGISLQAPRCEIGIELCRASF